MESSRSYVDILEKTLESKLQYLRGLMEATGQQEVLIRKEEIDSDSFVACISRKEELLTKIEAADDGFEAIYSRVKVELEEHGDVYREEIPRLQKLITQITEESVALQASEQRNHNQMQAYFARKKKEIKDFHVNNKTVSNYYRNMADKHQGQSYFLDSKK